MVLPWLAVGGGGPGGRPRGGHPPWIAAQGAARRSEAVGGRPRRIRASVNSAMLPGMDEHETFEDAGEGQADEEQAEACGEPVQRSGPVQRPGAPGQGQAKRREHALFPRAAAALPPAAPAALVAPATVPMPASARASQLDLDIVLARLRDPVFAERFRARVSDERPAPAPATSPRRQRPPRPPRWERRRDPPRFADQIGLPLAPWPLISASRRRLRAPLGTGDLAALDGRSRCPRHRRHEPDPRRVAQRDRRHGTPGCLCQSAQADDALPMAATTPEGTACSGAGRTPPRAQATGDGKHVATRCASGCATKSALGSTTRPPAWTCLIVRVRSKCGVDGCVHGRALEGAPAARVPRSLLGSSASCSGSRRARRLTSGGACSFARQGRLSRSRKNALWFHKAPLASRKEKSRVPNPLAGCTSRRRLPHRRHG
jgi:hypothetical protein